MIIASNVNSVHVGDWTAELAIIASNVKEEIIFLPPANEVTPVFDSVHRRGAGMHGRRSGMHPTGMHSCY